MLQTQALRQDQRDGDDPSKCGQTVLRREGHTGRHQVLCVVPAFQMHVKLDKCSQIIIDSNTALMVADLPGYREGCTGTTEVRPSHNRLTCCPLPPQMCHLPVRVFYPADHKSVPRTSQRDRKVEVSHKSKQCVKCRAANLSSYGWRQDSQGKSGHHDKTLT